MQLNKLSLATLAASLLLIQPAAATEPGDWLVRIGAAQVRPDASSDELGSIAGARLDVDDNTQLGITVTYMYSDNMGIGLLAATPFKHDIKGAGSIAGLGKVAEAKHLPPTLTAQYYFTPKSSVRPYVGAGINYTTFFSESGKGALAGHSVKLDDSWGLAFDAGVDIDINDNWFASAQLWYLDINTEASISGTTVNESGLDVDIDPWVIMVGIGTRF